MTEPTIPIDLYLDTMFMDFFGVFKFNFEPRGLARTTSMTEHTNLMDIDAMKILKISDTAKIQVPENAQLNVLYVLPFFRYLGFRNTKIYEDMPLVHGVFTTSIGTARALPAYRVWFPTIEFNMGPHVGNAMHDIRADELYHRLVHLYKFGDTEKKIHIFSDESTITE